MRYFFFIFFINRKRNIFHSTFVSHFTYFIARVEMHIWIVIQKRYTKDCILFIAEIVEYSQKIPSDYLSRMLDMSHQKKKHIIVTELAYYCEENYFLSIYASLSQYQFKQLGSVFGILRFGGDLETLVVYRIYPYDA